VADEVGNADFKTLAMRFAEILNREARDLVDAGADVIQFDEPCFNIYLDEVVAWGIETLEQAMDGVRAQKAVHICYGYGTPTVLAWSPNTPGGTRRHAAAAGRAASIGCRWSRGFGRGRGRAGRLREKDVLLGVTRCKDVDASGGRGFTSALAYRAGTSEAVHRLRSGARTRKAAIGRYGRSPMAPAMVAHTVNAGQRGRTWAGVCGRRSNRFGRYLSRISSYAARACLDTCRNFDKLHGPHQGDRADANPVHGRNRGVGRRGSGYAGGHADRRAGPRGGDGERRRPRRRRGRDAASGGAHCRSPNMNGIWQAMGSSYWNLEDHSASATQFWQLGAIGAIPAGQSVITEPAGGTIPYLPAALKKRDELRAGWPKSDPEAKCYMPGIPRATYMPYPFQIVQGQKVVLFVLICLLDRIVHGESHRAPVDSWMGWSTARTATRWHQCERLQRFDLPDRAGNHHTESLTVERYTMQATTSSSTKPR
jgi:hypothetical protein